MIIIQHGRPIRTNAQWYTKTDTVCPQCGCIFRIEDADTGAAPVGLGGPDNSITIGGVTIPSWFTNSRPRKNDAATQGITPSPSGALELPWQKADTTTVTYAGMAQSEVLTLTGPCPECHYTITLTNPNDGLSIFPTFHTELDDTNLSWNWAKLVHHITYITFTRVGSRLIGIALDPAKTPLKGFDSRYPEHVWIIWHNIETGAIYVGAEETLVSDRVLVSPEDAALIDYEMVSYIVNILGLIPV